MSRVSRLEFDLIQNALAEMSALNCAKLNFEQGQRYASGKDGTVKRIVHQLQVRLAG
jgi:hypothetical protein